MSHELWRVMTSLKSIWSLAWTFSSTTSHRYIGIKCTVVDFHPCHCGIEESKFHAHWHHVDWITEFFARKCTKKSYDLNDRAESTSNRHMPRDPAYLLLAFLEEIWRQDQSLDRIEGPGSDELLALTAPIMFHLEKAIISATSKFRLTIWID